MRREIPEMYVTIFTFPFLWLFEHTLFFFQLERTYQQKSDSLLHKERNSIERMQREQDVGLINTVYCKVKSKSGF